MNALQRLSIHTTALKRAKYPNVPAHAIVETKFSDKDTNSLTKAVLQRLINDGAFASRISSTGTYRKDVGFTFSNTRNGIPDVIACVPIKDDAGNTFGLFISTEIKAAATKDKMRPAQEECRKEIEAANGVYLIASTYSQWEQDYLTAIKKRGGFQTI